MKRFEIEYDDLHPDAQLAYLEFQGVENASDLPIGPLASFEIQEKEED